MTPPYIYLTGVGKRDKPLAAIGKGLGAKSVHLDVTLKGGLSVFWGFGDPVEEKMFECWKKNIPFLHLDHAYFKRGYEHGNVRLNFNHFHQTKLYCPPDDRAELARKRLEPWRKGRDIVVVSPSERICRMLSRLRGVPSNARDWCRQVEAELKSYTDRPIVRKDKGGSFLDAIRNAHAVVSLSSVAEVEAVVHGVPVFVTQDSPAHPVGLTNLSRIESPIYPDRDMWLRTLSYSQFHTSELADGTAITKIRELYGDQHLCGVGHGGRESSPSL